MWSFVGQRDLSYPGDAYLHNYGLIDLSLKQANQQLCTDYDIHTEKQLNLNIRHPKKSSMPGNLYVEKVTSL